MTKYTLRDLDLAGKRVFVRVDFNVPVDDAGRITSDNRIRAALPTIEYILTRQGIPILASHFGRPKGMPNPKYSLEPVARRLAELTGWNVKFVRDCVGAEAEQMVQAAAPGEILLLENLRFHPEEEKNESGFARQLAQLADLYVNDAFGAAHRAHASTEGITRHFATPAAGLLMEREISFLSQITEKPSHPFTAIIGGAKVTDKLGVIHNLLPKVDNLLLGGGLVFNFLKAKGLEIGCSICEDEKLDAAQALLGEPKLKIPSDIVVADSRTQAAQVRTVRPDGIPAGWYGLDIGPMTAQTFSNIVSTSNTVVWAGPLGLFEDDRFAQGTRAVAQALADVTARGATSVVGGGDTAAALNKFGLKSQVSHVSTGGGACLEFLEGRDLPGIRALKDK